MSKLSIEILISYALALIHIFLFLLKYGEDKKTVIVFRFKIARKLE